MNRELAPALALRTLRHVRQPTTNEHTPTRFGNEIGVVRLEGDMSAVAETRETARPAAPKDHTPIDDGAIHRQDRKVAVPDERNSTESDSAEQSPARVLVELVHHDLVLFGHLLTSDAKSERQHRPPTAVLMPGANVPQVGSPSRPLDD
jgi:hypothetical protein